MSLLHTTPVGSFCCAADFKRHVGDVEAALARKTDEIHQYRHKLEAELSGMCHTHSHTLSQCVILYVLTFRYECALSCQHGQQCGSKILHGQNNQNMVCGDRQLNVVGLVSDKQMLNPGAPFLCVMLLLLQPVV